MPKQVPDDFSFLPTVDSTEEEVLEKQMIWKAERLQPQPEAEASLPTPRAPEPVRLRDEKTRWPTETPAVSLSGRHSSKGAIAPVAPPPLPVEKSKVEAPADPPANPKPFIAPKPKPEEPENPDITKKKTHWRKLAEKIGVSSLGLSVGVHLFLLLVAAFVGVSTVMDRQVDFLPGGSSPHSEAAAENLAQKIQQKRNPWLKAKPRMQKVTAQTIAAGIVLPEMPPMDMMDFSNINNRMDISKAAAIGAGQPMGMGTGGAGEGFGAGIGRGGKFSFVGQTAFGRRVVFVVDVSGSMSQPLNGDGQRVTRFDLLKKELIKAVKQIPSGTAYQILYFSDFAWPHNQVDSRNENELEKYRWNIKPDDYKQVKIPPFKYLQASPFTIQDSVEIIQRSENPGLTNWGAGLLMAINANPKPDVIFFMTDGERQDEMGWIDIVTAENKRKLPMAVIHTSVMAHVDAAREMDNLARRNNGKFTVVMGEGKVIKGEDYFKMR
jgi:hypothetical protein